MQTRKYTLFILALVFSFFDSGTGQTLKSGGFRLGGVPTPGPTSNSINDILVMGDDVWIGTRDLSRTSDNGANWVTYPEANRRGKGGISAIAVRNDTIWVAAAFDTTTELGTFDAGGGLSYSVDNGETWHWIPQPVDADTVTAYKPTTTNIQNITYDIALTGSTVWITSFGGGLRKSSDMGANWQVVTVDGYPFDALGHLTHRAFSVMFDGRALWVGTAGGVHKSKDGGETWTTYSHQNQPQSISGNFVVAVGYQYTGERDLIWAATIEALGAGEYRGVSMTEDGGLTWKVMLEGEFPHNFGFDPVDGSVYVPTDNGLFKSLDEGGTWAVFPQIVDVESDNAVYTSEMYSAGIGENQEIWVGSADGLAFSRNSGISWHIFRTFPIPGQAETPSTYAYPNPFSPMRDNLIGGDGHVRFQYSTGRAERITLRIYDFGMNLVRTVVEEKDRFVPGSYAEVWNGENDLGEPVANGVYFYKIVMSGGNTYWGKVMVVN
jgi:photosystem II stability/assembly factor-like uncharacterized protein